MPPRMCLISFLVTVRVEGGFASADAPVFSTFAIGLREKRLSTMSARAPSSRFSFDALITNSSDIHTNRIRMNYYTNRSCDLHRRGTESPIGDCSKYH